MDEKGFKVSVLASGSSGNVLYIETPKKRILVDAGLAGKKIISLFSEINRNPSSLDAILITHEHSDHIKGVGVLARKFQLDVYANEDTWKVIEGKVGKLESAQKHIFKMGEVKTFGDIDVESFGVSHDAISPQCYIFHKDGKTFVMLTDTGYVSDHMRRLIDNADVYLIESNHDVQMLRMGSYSWDLKQRILGDKGHLSNEDSAKAMADCLGDKTKRIYLGHLSQGNNLKELARMTMENTLKELGGVNKMVRIYDTYAKCATEIFKV
ncbi:MAG: MBL fold metallo-hydrolase [Streptococcaceae bacterium]|jgi:phosphoribosyl 1,2-cyclic phosphodiesterase|nr:MBL fold metallo-hydrolase [Streptococcaceae bacterium]